MRQFEITGESLPEERKQMLSRWLGKPEMSILQTVIAAKCRLAEQDAIEQAHQACSIGEGHDRAAMAGGLVLKAQRYFIALEVLSEIQSTPDGWQTVKLKS